MSLEINFATQRNTRADAMSIQFGGNRISSHATWNASVDFPICLSIFVLCVRGIGSGSDFGIGFRQEQEMDHHNSQWTELSAFANGFIDCGIALRIAYALSIESSVTAECIIIINSWARFALIEFRTEFRCAAKMWIYLFAIGNTWRASLWFITISAEFSL